MSATATRRPSSIITWLGLAAIIIALGLLASGVIGSATYWFVLWIIAVAHSTSLLVWTRRLETEVTAAAALMASIESSMVAAVRCAGCHVSAVLARGGPPEGDTVPLPPGWGLSHDRTYCGPCLAKVGELAPGEEPWPRH